MKAAVAPFVDRLRLTIELTIGDAKTSIPAGNVKRLELAIEPWGFTGAAEMWIVSQGAGDPDPLFQGFVGRDRATVKVSLARAFDDPDEAAVATTFTGVVTSRSVVERAAESVQGAPVLQRRYAVRFADRARADWSRHRPTKAYVDSTLQKLVDDHVPSGWTVSHSWAASKATHAVLALGLGEEANDASFYDFLHWLLAKHDASVCYDPAADAYALRDSAPPASGDPESIDVDLVHAVDAWFPRTPRASVHVLNTYSEAATRDAPIPNADGASGVRRDVLLRSAIGSDLDALVALETLRAKPLGPETRVVFKQFPAVPLVPPMRAKLGEGFSAALREGSDAMRVVGGRLLAIAQRQRPGDDDGDETSSYSIEHEVRLVGSSDGAPRHPPFVVPAWPLFVEGKVVSETGEATDETYQPYTDDATSLDRYKVEVPLFAGIKVVAPFDAGTLAGHFYFPLTKGARVLLALDLDRARIAAVLDWRAGARLPLETQGDHLLLGKSATSQTSVRHVYTDGKPVFTIVRTSSTDVQTIEVSDGRFYLETKDAGGA